MLKVRVPRSIHTIRLLFGLDTDHGKRDCFMQFVLRNKDTNYYPGDFLKTGDIFPSRMNSTAHEATLTRWNALVIFHSLPKNEFLSLSFLSTWYLFSSPGLLHSHSLFLSWR